MPLTQAQTLVADLVTVDADADADRAALDKLAIRALRLWSPVVSADPPDGLVIDIAGCAHVYGGETKMVAAMLTALKALGLTARAAVADSWGAAHALARYAARPMIIVPPGDGGKAVLDLPAAALRLSDTLADSLYSLGFERIADLAASPRAPLLQRFGPELLRRLDQASGRAHEPIEPVRPPGRIEVERVFAEPIGAPETMARYTGKLTAQLCDRLEIAAKGARRLDLLFTRVDNRVEAIRIAMARPVRDAKRLTCLLCDRIETVDPGFGIERMRLCATWTEPLASEQTSSAVEDVTDLSGLIDTLTNRLGPGRVYRQAPVPSDVPERLVRRIAPLAAPCGEDWPPHWPRPARLFARPEPIHTLSQLPDYPPRAFTWRGRRHHVRLADGPERIFGEWWKRDSETHAIRDYFRVENEAGERFWIFRNGDGESQDPEKHRWFMHGVFA